MARACEFCRRRKIRCDASKPACSTCRKSKRSCVYHNTPPKQRPSAALIDSLQTEKAALEDALSRLKSADDAERRALLDSMIVRDGRISLSDRSGGSTASSPRERSALRTEHGMEQQLLRGHAVRMRENGGDATNSVDTGHGNDSVEHETDRALPRTYKSHVTSDGIFSSTSVVHVSRPMTSPEQPAASTESLRYQLIANAAMERQREHRLRRLTVIRGIPADLALHLLDLHWSRQHHTFLLTYRPAFMRELEHGGPYCSDLLLYAVFACASKFSERPEVRSNPVDPETAGRCFFNRCQELLLVEGLMTQSSIPTVIALVMLGSTLIARGRTCQGWLYTGYAMRMVYDLGLYFELQEPNKHNVEEIEIRRRVFWGAFVCEKLQSLYLGRPPTIRLQDVHVSKDFMDTFEELEPVFSSAVGIFSDYLPAAARRITSLALRYQSIYPLRKSSYLLSYAVYVACTIHVLNTASLSVGSDGNAHAESSYLLSASLRCLDALAVPNSGAADTARIIRKLMAAKGVPESRTPSEVQASTPHRNPDNGWQFPDYSPTNDDSGQIPPFPDIFIPRQDLLFGFMNENMPLAVFDMSNPIL
ncbi:fungal-specific transcription factor domain-containing protein [Aspergillus arachidicola]|uniref:Fungal-specific transcription factor domain-containing protein n=1 Tax=Aspergillus arachidicola TaxID=656916 RepID=A0A5N6XST8_9EURO|nr:fungal-specific transcription factor domain-containing protein [Aspergillus arachidicola]